MRPHSKFTNLISPTLLEDATMPVAAVSLADAPQEQEPDAPETLPSALSPADSDRVFLEYAETRDERLRNQLVLSHQKLVRSVAMRFVSTSETLDDLIQVGNIGLINALKRFDPAQGNRFSTFAIPTILGVIKRHFRDKTTDVKVPRFLYERHIAVRRMISQMTQELGQSPGNDEIALRMGISEAEVNTALICGQAINTMSLDSHPALDSLTLLDRVGEVDRALSEFDRYGDLRKAMEALSEREQELLRLRYFEELSQAKIGQHLGISQMHVSRIQHRALSRLREMLRDDIEVVGTTKRTRTGAKAQRRKE